MPTPGQAHEINGRVVRLKSYDDESVDDHEHVIRNKPSFADFIDRELQDRIRLAEEGQMKINNFISKLNEAVIIEFKSFNIDIIKLSIVRCNLRPYDIMIIIFTIILLSG